MKPYKDIGNVQPEYEDETLLDEVVALVGQFKKRSAIFTKLQEDFPEIPIVTVSILISRAKAKIRETLNVDPQDYRGQIIEALIQVIGGKSKHRDRLKALDMLAEFTGVKTAANEDPSDYAQRVCEAMKEMDASVDGSVIEKEEETEETSE